MTHVLFLRELGKRQSKEQPQRRIGHLRLFLNADVAGAIWSLVWEASAQLHLPLLLVGCFTVNTTVSEFHYILKVQSWIRFWRLWLAFSIPSQHKQWHLCRDVSIVEKKSYHQVYDAWLAPIMHHIWWTSEAGFHFCCRWFGQFGIMFGIAGQLQHSFKTILKQADLELIDLWILATTQLLVLLHFIFWFHSWSQYIMFFNSDKQPNFSFRISRTSSDSTELNCT